MKYGKRSSQLRLGIKSIQPKDSTFIEQWAGNTKGIGNIVSWSTNHHP